VQHGYVTWCDQCGWNLSPPKPRASGATRLDRLYARAGRRLGDRLVAELLAAEQLEPRLTPVRAGAYGLAAFVHFLAVAFLVGGAALIVLTFFNVFGLVIGVVLIGLAVSMRPRFGSPPDEGIVARDKAPALFAIVDEVARSLEVARVDVLAVDRRFNASWATVGLRRRRVLVLGLPLLTILEPQERVALLAHELAHGRNGDSTRGLFVGSAVRGLSECYYVVGPEDLSGVREWGDFAFLERIVNVLLWILSRPVLGLLLLELHLLLRDSQRAEFLADALAARVAGTDAAIGLEEKVLLESTVWQAVQHSSRERSAPADLFEQLAGAAVGVPARERERRRRVARLEEARLDETHPPSAHRIRLLEERPHLGPQVVLDSVASAAIDSELAPRRPDLARALVDEYRESLYG
jgi:Zn-dependent protease with chaperone function